MEKIALEIGHTPASGGASHSATHITEYDLNSTLARAVAHRIKSHPGLEVIPQVMSRDWDDPRGENLPEKINNMDVDAVVGMHFNAFKGPAKGAETLYWPTSEGGRVLAENLVARFSRAMDNENRGATPRDWDSENTRGVRFLAETEPVYVLSEPAFIDTELHAIQSHFVDLVEAYFQGIQETVEAVS